MGMAPSNCSHKECILVIDDDERFLEMLKAALECFNFIVHTASSPKEAITLYRDHQRDISMVLLDYRLPGSSGELVFESLQSLNPDVRVVLLTGHQESVADMNKGLALIFGMPSMPRNCVLGVSMDCLICSSC
jgi:DNA-binding NtrC family response regulator